MEMDIVPVGIRLSQLGWQITLLGGAVRLLLSVDKVDSGRLIPPLLAVLEVEENTEAELNATAPCGSMLASEVDGNKYL